MFVVVRIPDNYAISVTENSRMLRGMQEDLWKMASERRTELESDNLTDSQ